MIPCKDTELKSGKDSFWLLPSVASVTAAHLVLAEDTKKCWKLTREESHVMIARAQKSRGKKSSKTKLTKLWSRT